MIARAVASETSLNVEALGEVQSRAGTRPWPSTDRPMKFGKLNDEDRACTILAAVSKTAVPSNVCARLLTSRRHLPQQASPVPSSGVGTLESSGKGAFGDESRDRLKRRALTQGLEFEGGRCAECGSGPGRPASSGLRSCETVRDLR